MTSALFAQAAAEHPTLTVAPAAFDAAWKARSNDAPLDPARAGDVFMAVALEHADSAAVQWLRREIARARSAPSATACQSTCGTTLSLTWCCG